ncbi:MlaA family lipoprotein [Pseudomonas sp. CGJS7]|uniref:MlaA family lipoprotein n=1 Tax=Pseudomonas sp. CGJS7 TaxID=3109348 RepID=UPI00300BF3C2
MRPHALPLALALALTALHSVPALAFEATPAPATALQPAQADAAQAAIVAEPLAIETVPTANAAEPLESTQLAVQTDSAVALAAAGVHTDAEPLSAAPIQAAPADTVAATEQEATALDVTQTLDGLALSPLSLDYALAQIDPASAPPSSGTVDPTATPDPRTDAERDFDDIYGVQSYDPVADPTLPAPANVPGAYDPWEKYNRRMHRFNLAVDRGVARPLARAYSKVVPRPIRLGVSNFFNNLGQPVSILNALLQGKPKQALQSFGRFALNTTLGIGGIFDPATAAKLPNRSEDFGQTLGVWGWKRSRYVELPFFGPRTVRDTFGMVGDAPLSPLRQIERDRIRIPLQGLQLVDVRAQLLPLDSLRDGAEDEYALVRDSWTQRRDYQIFGDRMEKNGETQLPEYLQDDSNPSVPADAMPMMPTDGTGVR